MRNKLKSSGKNTINHNELIQTICVPGFLGCRSDFSWVDQSHLYVDLFNEKFCLTDFNNFLPTIVENLKLHPPFNAIGYSLGGRLVLNAMLSNPGFFNKVVIISSHTGLDSNIERQQRLESDLAWAQKFSSDFQSAYSQWNKQEVFAGHTLTRTKDTFDPPAITHALTTWSLGRMPNISCDITRFKLPILWLVGETDLKYVTLAHRVAENCPNITVRIIPNCGHRLMWQATEQVKVLVDEFLKH